MSCQGVSGERFSASRAALMAREPAGERAHENERECGSGLHKARRIGRLAMQSRRNAAGDRLTEDSRISVLQGFLLTPPSLHSLRGLSVLRKIGLDIGPHITR